MKCKYCGKEKTKSEFDQFFTKEALENMPCSVECKEKQLKEADKIVDETKRHPEWHGPVNQSEPY